ncbi:MAG: chromosomal replication initiator protein DnaA, partial [Moorea sp. SIO4A3]|nr:chromosomal replication initiator protein DnaA [Moorena sp. SIO4A3]
MKIYPEQLWIQVLERLKLQLSQPTFETWLETTTAQQLDNNCLVIRTPNPFSRNWLQKYYVKTIADVVEDILGQPVEIHFTTATG